MREDTFCDSERHTMLKRFCYSEHFFIYSWTPFSAGNTFQDLPRLCETAENTERYIQGGAEPTDTFQMVIDNIWKQGKINETVYKYVQVCYLLPTDYKLIF